ncbi:MAG: hypothetical protein NTW59_04945, partial [Candidatus Diapherotrites archaeon]|nr:hypothetical protein [Candidatus Diapherotrites archaeon]
KKLDITLIDTEEVAARAVELMINMPAVSDLVNTGIGQFDIFEVHAGGTKTVGKKAAEIRCDGYACLATYRNGEYNFDKDQKIEKDHTLIMLTGAGKEKETIKKLKSGKWKK